MIVSPKASRFAKFAPLTFTPSFVGQHVQHQHVEQPLRCPLHSATILLLLSLQVAGLNEHRGPILKVQLNANAYDSGREPVAVGLLVPASSLTLTIALSLSICAAVHQSRLVANL
jgi:hypothetical protein